MAEALLEVKDLVAGYDGTSVLCGISLKVEAGSIVAVLGANGVGKTTLNKVLSGIVRPQRGEVIFDGQRIDRKSPADIVAAGLVHVPEGRKLFPDLSVRENLELGSYRRGKAERARTMEQVLTVFPRLKERFEQRAGTLSGGEQQMVAIGRALMAKPTLLILDEPSLGLAPKVVTEIFRTIRNLRDGGLTLLMVEQNAYQALRIAGAGGDPWALPHGRPAAAHLRSDRRTPRHFPATVQRASYFARRRQARHPDPRHRGSHDREDARHHSPSGQTGGQAAGPARTLPRRSPPGSLLDHPARIATAGRPR